jgi:hypothetical protein
MQPESIQQIQPLSSSQSQLVAALNQPELLMKRQILKLVGKKFRFFAGDQAVLFAEQKGFKMKEEIRICLDEQLQKPVIGIFARQIIDFSAKYDVVDLETNQRIGVFERKGWQSIIQDTWIVYDAWEREIGQIKEDHLILALVRRFLSNLVPQNFDLTVGGARTVDLKQTFNPFTYNLKIQFMVPPEQFDRRIGLAGALLLGCIEGRQN